jgi:hypothetical protein
MRGWFILGAILGWLFSIPAWAQQAPPDPQRRQKEMQYTQIEYQRCRSDLFEIWEKGDVAEKRAKDLEEEVRKLTEELATLRGKADAKPSN